MNRHVVPLADHVCKFCGRKGHYHPLIKYAAKHYAHPECYLRKGKRLEDVPDSFLDAFTEPLLREFGLLDTHARLTERR